jgi:HlyD family secretion protein
MLLREGATPRLTFEKAEKDFVAAEAEFNSAQAVSKGADEKVSSLAREGDLAKKIVDAKTQELEQAKADLAATEVHSPVDGIVLARKGETGTEVTRDTKDLFQIATDLSDMVVSVEPEPPILQRLEPGSPAAVIISEFNNEPLFGQIAEIKGNVVLVEFKSPSIEIRPGLTAQVRLKIK